MKRSVAIVALASFSQPTKVDLGLYDEIWTVNNAHDHYNVKTDLIIAMDDLERDENVHPEYVNAIVNAGVPVLSTGAKEKWPNVEAYPLQQVCDFLRQYHAEPWLILDNTVNYAFALALTNAEFIGIYGADWCPRYRPNDLADSLKYFAEDGYHGVPDWFKYYHPLLMVPRRPTEPGIESFHFLFGIATAIGKQIVMSETTTTLNKDRDKFFYGYQEQPHVD